MTQPADIRYFEDFNSYLVQTKTTYQGWDADAWATASLLESHLLFGSMPAERWEKAKLLVLIRNIIEVLQRQTLDELVKYVGDGGTLVMRPTPAGVASRNRAVTGRFCDGLGLLAPVGARVDDQYTKAALVPGWDPARPMAAR